MLSTKGAVQNTFELRKNASMSEICRKPRVITSASMQGWASRKTNLYQPSIGVPGQRGYLAKRIFASRSVPGDLTPCHDAAPHYQQGGTRGSGSSSGSTFHKPLPSAEPLQVGLQCLAYACCPLGTWFVMQRGRGQKLCPEVSCSVLRHSVSLRWPRVQNGGLRDQIIMINYRNVVTDSGKGDRGQVLSLDSTSSGLNGIGSVRLGNIAHASYPRS